MVCDLWKSWAKLICASAILLRYENCFLCAVERQISCNQLELRPQGGSERESEERDLFCLFILLKMKSTTLRSRLHFCRFIVSFVTVSLNLNANSMAREVSLAYGHVLLPAAWWTCLATVLHPCSLRRNTQVKRILQRTVKFPGVVLLSPMWARLHGLVCLEWTWHHRYSSLHFSIQVWSGKGPNTFYKFPYAITSLNSLLIII